MNNQGSSASDDEEEKDPSAKLFTQVQFMFAYGLPNSFQNILKRDANLPGDPHQDAVIIANNFIDFVGQMGFDLSFMEQIISEQIADFTLAEEEEMEEQMREASQDEEGPSANQQTKNLQNAIVVEGRAYEDVEDIVADEEYFNKFVERFTEEGNTVFQKIVFRAFLNEILSQE